MQVPIGEEQAPPADPHPAPLHDEPEEGQQGFKPTLSWILGSDASADTSDAGHESDSSDQSAESDGIFGTTDIDTWFSVTQQQLRNAGNQDSQSWQGLSSDEKHAALASWTGALQTVTTSLQDFFRTALTAIQVS
jgi:hypothetical protein